MGMPLQPAAKEVKQNSISTNSHLQRHQALVVCRLTEKYYEWCMRPPSEAHITHHTSQQLVHQQCCSTVVRQQYRCVLELLSKVAMHAI